MNIFFWISVKSQNLSPKPTLQCHDMEEEVWESLRNLTFDHMFSLADKSSLRCQSFVLLSSIYNATQQSLQNTFSSSIIKRPKYCFMAILNKAFYPLTNTPLRRSLIHPFVILFKESENKLFSSVFASWLLSVKRLLVLFCYLLCLYHPTSLSSHNQFIHLSRNIDWRK